MKKKMIALILACVLVLGCGIGGTIAWLVDKPDAVVNTFTVGNIDIELTETDADNDSNKNENSYKMIPGDTIEKDPTVTVYAGSEACWLFVQIDESCDVPIPNASPAANYKFDDFITYVTVEGWKAGEGSGEGKNGIPTNVYYREVNAIGKEDGNVQFKIIGNKGADGEQTLIENQVLVNTSVNKTMMDALADASNGPQLKIQACAVQKANRNLAEAWEEANKLLNPRETP